MLGKGSSIEPKVVLSKSIRWLPAGNVAQAVLKRDPSCLSLLRVGILNFSVSTNLGRILALSG